LQHLTNETIRELNELTKKMDSMHTDLDLYTTDRVNMNRKGVLFSLIVFLIRLKRGDYHEISMKINPFRKEIAMITRFLDGMYKTWIHYNEADIEYQVMYKIQDILLDIRTKFITREI